MAPSSHSPSLAKAEAEGRQTKIVVVEDNPLDVFLIKEVFRKYRPDAALDVLKNGEEAIQLILRLEEDDSAPCPRLILLDVNLPRTDGFNVLERLRQSRRSASIPVIVVTSSSAQADQRRAAELGAKAYFKKPAGYDEFMKVGDIIQKVLNET
jgi:CheY-like chemotaxis protein